MKKLRCASLRSALQRCGALSLTVRTCGARFHSTRFLGAIQLLWGHDLAQNSGDAMSPHQLLSGGAIRPRVNLGRVSTAQTSGAQFLGRDSAVLASKFWERDSTAQTSGLWERDLTAQPSGSGERDQLRKSLGARFDSANSWGHDLTVQSSGR